MEVCDSSRLIIRHFKLSDWEFVVRLLNEPAFIKFISDKNVRNKDDAEIYLSDGPMASYKTNGFGLNLVLLKETDTPVGMCGLVKRPELALPDLGFAFLSDYWANGFAYEASRAILSEAFTTHDLDQILAVSLPSNDASNRLLIKLGFKFQEQMTLYDSVNNLYKINR